MLSLDMNKAIAEKYLDGYEGGLAWPDDWEDHSPGGPWVPSLGYGPNEKQRVMHEQYAAENKAWLAGWKEGHDKKIATGRKNPRR